MTANPRARVLQEFERRFGGPPLFLARAPGRVNLIGDHTDYNGGFVLPMAIDRAVWIALRPRDDQRVSVASLDFDEHHEFELTGEGGGGRREGGGRRGWIEYLRGVAWALRDAGHSVRGWEGVAAGDVPVGAGLSSSAALELATARAFAGISGLAWQSREMALIAQRAENDWVGMNCGIMDQLISAAGVAGHAVLIDCRSLQTTAVPLPVGAAVVVLDTGTRRGLVDSLYNERRTQCERAAAFFGVAALRDVALETFASRALEMDSTIRRRARHVITENARTLAAAAALQRADVGAVGRLMNESHLSLRDDFEVSRRELDVMVELAQGNAACYGARLTGAGFGGCAVALVDRGGAPRFSADVVALYEREIGLTPAAYLCSASEGAMIERLACG